MFASLSPLELGRLRMSVGYGTHKKGRPLTPVEVGLLLHKARCAGISLSDCAKALHLDGTSHIRRFLHILELPQDLQHLIDWGGGKGIIGFSCACELVRLQDADDQRIVSSSILENGLYSKEVQQVAQLRNRSGRPICECIKEVLDMRIKVEKRYIFIGTIVQHDVEKALASLTQLKRDSILTSSLEQIGLQGVSGRLGTRLFTLIGDRQFNASMEGIGKGSLERLLRNHIAEKIENG